MQTGDFVQTDKRKKTGKRKRKVKVVKLTKKLQGTRDGRRFKKPLFVRGYDIF